MDLLCANRFNLCEVRECHFFVPNDWDGARDSFIEIQMCDA